MSFSGFTAFISCRIEESEGQKPLENLGEDVKVTVKWLLNT
jgi:hypothetical protein